MDNLLSLAQAALKLNVHPETLRRWDREEKLKAVRVNDRGDRRYRESDIAAFINGNPKLLQYNQITTHAGYTIHWDSDGFLGMPANFGIIGRLIAQKDDEFIGFAFAISGMSAFARVGEKDNYAKSAIDKIKDYVDKKLINDNDIFTFEFENGEFIEVQNPEWWQGKYSKSLVPGLRVEAVGTHPTTLKNLAWRVNLHFTSKQRNYWVTNTFGEKNALHEYFVWIDAKELISKGLPNKEKYAEILAMQFIIQRFEETKDENGNRDITRIKENNTACFNGKCIKDSWLPDKLM